MDPFSDIKLEAASLGRDLLVTITGGEVHIGAASTAYWTDGRVDVQTAAVPGHKEHVLTVKLAQRAAAQLHCTVTLVMGIHYDNLTKLEIDQISKRTEQLMEQYLLQAERRNGDEQHG
ncbi:MULTISPECIES: prenylated flavin chaperone LpdD [Paenibacillus]|uniref:Prenylated flavin chaperone LpdD-like domain-containing protein n=1 Tax=Paenibacillus apis TaxID=1792174 RepID=A0A919Y5N4_9BACL|nr:MULTISPECIES: hypothetical protein [Paenibacillus]GIO43703.1 hypothetical protein J41TS4_34610 [Paenibacillus apis]